MPITESPIKPAYFQFLEELGQNNDRDWFNANKHRYLDDVRDAMSRLIIELQGPLHEISPLLHIDPKPQGGSMTRIYRDVRFSKNKTPYKTALACHFAHGKDRHDFHFGYFLHLGLEECRVGGGIWQAPTETTYRLRQGIYDHTDQWDALMKASSFARHFDGMVGDQLKRVPKQFDPDHPYADDLRRKNFGFVKVISKNSVLEDSFVADTVSAYQALVPVLEFFTPILGVAWK